MNGRFYLLKLKKQKLISLTQKQAINEKIKSLLDGADAKYTAWQNALLSKKEADLLAKFDRIKFELGLIPKIQNMNSELVMLNRR